MTIKTTHVRSKTVTGAITLMTELSSAEQSAINGPHVKYSVAFCSKKDSFNKVDGTSLAGIRFSNNDEEYCGTIEVSDPPNHKDIIYRCLSDIAARQLQPNNADEILYKSIIHYGSFCHADIDPTIPVIFNGDVGYTEAEAFSKIHTCLEDMVNFQASTVSDLEIIQDKIKPHGPLSTLLTSLISHKTRNL